MSIRWFLLCLALAAFASAGVSAGVSAAEPDPSTKEFFEQKIRPVLVEHCYECHSQKAIEEKKLKGSLLLDTKAGMLKGGDNGPAIVPGKPKEGHLMEALHYEGDIQMPPKAKLSDEIIADFEKWIEKGAIDPREGAATLPAKRTIDIPAGRDYWAFRALANSAIPAVKQGAWARNDIDKLLLAKLESAGITPNPAAAPEILLRRVYLDLTGLPPTPEEIEAFLKDPSPAAYDLVVDRLLASDAYGERWARHWLDVVRFAESGGYEFDGDRRGAYHYRDFVIKALREDLPYNEFIRLQVAGDLLKPGDYFATSATGFLVAGPYPGQTTAKTQELIRYNHLDDMISTMGTSLLGLSFGCVRCHEHKYDPIPQDDYYRIAAVLGRTDSMEAKLDPDPATTQRLLAEFEAAHAPFVAAREKFVREEMPARLTAWYAAAKDRPSPTWIVAEPTSATGKSPLVRQGDGSWLASGKAEKGDAYTLTIPTALQGITALRLEFLPDASLPKSGPGRGAEGEFQLTEVTLAAAVADAKPTKKGKPGAIALAAASASAESPSGKLAMAVDNNAKTGWTVTGAAGQPQVAVFDLPADVGFAEGTVFTLALKFEGESFSAGRVRVSFSTAMKPVAPQGLAAPQPEVELLAMLRPVEGKLPVEKHSAAVAWFRHLDDNLKNVVVAEEASAAKKPQPNLVNAFVATGNRGGPVHFLVRGEVERKQGQANPGFVRVLMRNDDDQKSWLTPTATAPAIDPRIALGNWLTDTDRGAGNLLARVIVNRLWQHHFGRGLVATPNDFGVQGEKPSHPELLDYLAAELIRGGWKLKPIHKRMVSSAAYRESSAANESGQKNDPMNRLIWRRVPQRLEGEVIRDAILSASGTLDPTSFGPGSLDANINRRSVYLTVKRSQLVPWLQAFDAPEAVQSIGERQATTNAAQSLAMMNSPFVRQRAEKLAKRVRPAADVSLEAAIDRAYLTVIGRKPSATERENLLAFARSQAATYGGGPAGEEKGLVDVCHLVFCLNEFVYAD